MYFIGGPADTLECPLKEEHQAMPPKIVRWYDGTRYELDPHTKRRHAHVYRVVEATPAP